MKFITKKASLFSNKDLDSIKFFLINAYQKEFPDYHTFVYTNPEIELTVLMYDKDNLIGHVSISKRTITHKNNTYIVGGVGDVAIHPEFQKKGLGIKLMKYTNNVLSKNVYDLGVLFCHPKLNALYSKADWLKKKKGIIRYIKNGNQEEEHTTYIFPLKITEEQRNDWLVDPIFIGEGTW